MSGLEDIGVKVVPPGGDELTGNALAILHEVAEALDELIASGESSAIDLEGVPLSEADYELLRETFAPGEVQARIDAMGPTEVFETIYPGVWWITHYNAEGDIIADVLEIAHVPEVLESHPDDVSEAAARLKELLSAREAGS
jgi:hydrogenase-1 operon protein HyaF